MDKCMFNHSLSMSAAKIGRIPRLEAPLWTKADREKGADGGLGLPVIRDFSAKSSRERVGELI